MPLAAANTETDAATTVTAAEPDIVHELEEMMTTLQDGVKVLDKGLKDARLKLKNLGKVYHKAISKKGGKRKAREGLNGFARPSLVSDMLASFVGIGSGERIARTDVTKALNEYVKSKDLKNPDNKREVVIDKPLSNLTGLDEGSKISLFGMQAYLKHHYVPDDPPAATTV